MNYLAHLHLAELSHTSLLGNFMGDFVRGQQYLHYPGELQTGIQLHRKIDSFTDHHPIITGLRPLFDGKLRRFSGIILDMLFDHLLAKEWQRYHRTPLPQFAQQSYHALQQSISPALPAMQETIEKMTRHNWLVRYQQRETLDRALERIGQRFLRPVSLQQSAPLIDRHLPQLTEQFHQFYPELIRYTQQMALTLSAANQSAANTATSHCQKSATD